MDTENNKNLNSLFAHGNLEIAKTLLASSKPVQFKTLRFILNPKTNKKFSSRTISKSLQALKEDRIIEAKIVKGSKKTLYGYKLTKEGKGLIMILNEVEEVYKKL